MSVCLHCGNTGLRPVERGPAGATYTVLARCECQTPTVTISCVKYEALMIAAKALEQLPELERNFVYVAEALTALRAAGINFFNQRGGGVENATSDVIRREGKIGNMFSSDRNP